MRSWIRRRRGALAAFTVGAVVATGATAGAASIITGKQIKDGTITSRDLSKGLRGAITTRAAAGAKGDPGAPGPKGDAGAPGPGAVKVAADVVSPAVATVTAATLGPLRVTLTGCQDISGAATLHLVSTAAAQITFSWWSNGTAQSAVAQAIGPGSDYDLPLLLGVGWDLVHGVYRDAAGGVSTLDLVLQIVNSGGNVRTCRVSGALVPAA